MSSILPGTDWCEDFDGDCPAAEERLLVELFHQSQRLDGFRSDERHSRHRRTPAASQTACGTRLLAGLKHARFQLLSQTSLPRHMRHGFFQPGHSFPATVRFANARALSRRDGARDLREVAIRLHFDRHAPHDFILVNAPSHYAENAVQLTMLESLFRGGARLHELVGLPGGPLGQLKKLADALKAGTANNVLRARIDTATARFRHASPLLALLNQTRRSRQLTSLITQDYWSRTPFKLGPFAVRFILRHTTDVDYCFDSWRSNALTKDIYARLETQAVTFDFLVQRFVDPQNTPIENAAAAWDEQVSLPEKVGELILFPQPQDRIAEHAIANERFDPWHNIRDDFLRPLGCINRARHLARALEQPARRFVS